MNCFKLYFSSIAGKETDGQTFKHESSFRCRSWGSGPKYLEVYGKLVSAFYPFWKAMLLNVEDWQNLQALLSKGAGVLNLVAKAGQYKSICFKKIASLIFLSSKRWLKQKNPWDKMNK